MGVPALFRWLSKKYPKIVASVTEEDEVEILDENDEKVSVPVNMADPNPNGVEFDNLYLDMNGIVHPCTHPEGKPAPETEQEMMVEIFKYTERVVNMIRPRKLLFMAIDGVAPRAKMNQQRSRRFRAAQEAKDKEETRKESLLLWESMGKEVSEEEKNVKSWDTNAITPGTPFMDLLSASLQYWVVQKMNTDPGWKQMQVIISDSSVPGEGEHKIMDFIRRQRVNPGFDPNIKHVLYGLDADLIMLALASHEPHFRILREDVFAQDISATACRTCGQEGHYSAQCTGTKADIVKKPPPEKKPFIFLDVSILREYLEVELNLPQQSFPFNLEQAIDDWVLLIFFVGNDFLPHLPSLEIREGAIDTLMRIWKTELNRMGGYLTNHGQMDLARLQIILEGLAKREDDIFRRRREAEERQDQVAKRRKLETSKTINAAVPSPSLGLTAIATTPSIISTPSLHPLPAKPDFAAKADSIGLGAPATAVSAASVPSATEALSGSNHDIVANRRAIRMANMNAAEMLKAQLSGASAPTEDKPNLSLPAKPAVEIPPAESPSTTAAPISAAPSDAMNEDTAESGAAVGDEVMVEPAQAAVSEDQPSSESAMDADADVDAPVSAVAGVKRKIEEVEGTETPDATSDTEDEPPAELAGSDALKLKVNHDGTVEQEDLVKLWEPGYRDRYYQQKFGVHESDKDFKRKITKHYVEGLCWVLHYYYQGTASWHWYYPYHFAPFAFDFTDVATMDIKFDLGAPARPYEQLMSVFPAASCIHIPQPFHHLMTNEDSPIIDFYPSTFQIDMNGKKMSWQGVALLPFIDTPRLLAEMAKYYDQISEEEKKRNTLGNDLLFASDMHPLYPLYEALYGKRKKDEPVALDVSVCKGVSGFVLPNPDCIPGSTYYSPLASNESEDAEYVPGRKIINLPDIPQDRSLSVLYFFPPQATPHRSMLMPGLKKPARQLTPQDIDEARYGGGGRGRGRGGRGGGGGGRQDSFHASRHTYDNPRNFGSDRPARGGYDRGGGRGGRGSYTNNSNNGYQGHNGSNHGRESYNNGPSYPPQNSHSRPQNSYGGPPPASYGGGGSGGYSHPPPSNNYGGYGGGNQGGYGGNYGGYGSYNSAPPPPPAQYGGGGRGGGYAGGNGYEGHRGYGGPPPAANSYGGYGNQGPPRGGYSGGGYGGGRGRGRGW